MFLKYLNVWNPNFSLAIFIWLLGLCLCSCVLDVLENLGVCSCIWHFRVCVLVCLCSRWTQIWIYEFFSFSLCFLEKSRDQNGIWPKMWRQKWYLRFVKIINFFFKKNAAVAFLKIILLATLSFNMPVVYYVCYVGNFH